MEEFIAEWFNADKVAMYLSWVAYIGTIIGLVANIKKLKQTNNLTLKNVSAELKDLLNNEIQKAVSGENQKYLPNVLKANEQMAVIMQTFAKVLALSQENTADSRVAILKILGELSIVGQELVDNVQEVVENQVTEIEQHKEDINNKLDEIIEKYDGTSI